ncbi:DNA mismatch repair protein MutS [Bienertia sinuspersici]
MGPEVDMSGELGTKMEVSPVSTKGNGSTVKLPEENLVVCASNCEDHAFVDAVVKTEENPVMACASSYEDNAFHMEASMVDCDKVMASKGNKEEVDVEIVEDVTPDEELVTDTESLDATENSSSFSCTDSETGTTGAFSDVEVESHLRQDDASLMEFDGISDLFRTRKKKVTTHWRNFVRPLMWRCKWVELQIRKLNSQASKYDRELAEYSRKKQCELEKSAAEDFASKSVPVCRNWPVKIMKRKKRKRVEETNNLAAYSSCHKLFSYFASKRPPVDAAYMFDDHSNTEKTCGSSGADECDIDVEWSFLDFLDNDPIGIVLQKIDEAQIVVRQLRLRVDEMFKEDAETRLVPGEPLASCGPSSTLPPVNGENIPLGSQSIISQKKLVKPESVVSGSVKVNPSEMIETTNQLRLRIGRKRDKIENETVLYTVKEEPDDTEVMETRDTGVKGKAKNVLNVSDPDSPSKVTVTREQLAVKARSKLATPKNKKKRGRRKARTGRWSKKSSG